MPAVKGGVWTNIEDEILKASVSKYGLNQWARVSSLLARKTAKQCKARWSEWLDPGIRKIEWSKDEDEKLLHLAKLMPTQWRTIAPIVGRTATQCLERYQKLLDEAEARENDEMSLGGPEGGESMAPSADDVRKLRPGELDPDPESKPAKPDTVDLDEDEKEMLSEARARLANTQGKKAKRKARERQLEESRRLAVLQKRRELKNAGINIKVTTRKKGQMDYNADIPFEKAPAPGFYDTQEEEKNNERERAMFDPRKQQLANKRKADEDDDGEDRKKKKSDKNSSTAASAAAAKAGQMQKIREAERSSKRRSLALPAPQVGESELEDIVKMGMLGERATQNASASDNEATRGLIGNYTDMVGSTPIRTPRAPQEEDRIANEIRNARLRTETQSALLGGDNVELYEGDSSTGYSGIAPTKQQMSTPNPLATPFRNQSMNGASDTPGGPAATPLRTPRDNFRLNDQTPGSFQAAGQTPREIRLRENAAKNSLKGRLAALPRPKDTEWELELPDEQEETASSKQISAEDAAIRDQRNLERRLAAEREDFRRQTQVIQKSLPRPTKVDLPAMLKRAESIDDPIERLLAKEAAYLIANDVKRFSNQKILDDPSNQPHNFADKDLENARLEIALELSSGGHDPAEYLQQLQQTWSAVQDSSSLPGLATYGDDDAEDNILLSEAFENVMVSLEETADGANTVEKKLAMHLGGYQARSKALRQKVVQTGVALEAATVELSTKRVALAMEEAAIGSRLEGLRTEVENVMRRERLAQDNYRLVKDELADLELGVSVEGKVNGWH